MVLFCSVCLFCCPCFNFLSKWIVNFHSLSWGNTVLDFYILKVMFLQFALQCYILSYLSNPSSMHFCKGFSFILLLSFSILSTGAGNHCERDKDTSDDPKIVINFPFRHVNGKVGSQGALCPGTVLETVWSVHKAVLWWQLESSHLWFLSLTHWNH